MYCYSNDDYQLTTYQIIHIHKIARHTDMDCQYPDHKDVISACHPWLLDSGKPLYLDSSFNKSQNPRLIIGRIAGEVVLSLRLKA